MQQHERNGNIEQFLQSLHSEESAEHDADIPQEEPWQDSTEQEAEEEIEETIHVYFVRESGKQQKDERVIESTPPRRPQSKSDLPAYIALFFGLFLPLSCLAFQLYLVFNPPTATVTLVPRSQTVTLSATLQIGRLLNPLTLSQSQTVATTGKGHQSAKSATGVITFYNGLFIQQTIAQGTILTGADGVQVVTDQDALLPAAAPPIFGQTTVSAHAITPGVRGNIPAYDIHQACCANAVLAKNTQAFYNGQDERDFQTVAKDDIATLATSLKTAVTQSMRAALPDQLKPQEQLQILPCPPAVTSDHQPGQEATQVKVTVSETCSAVAYNQNELAAKATGLLSHQAATQAGTSYSLLGVTRVDVIQATITHTATPLVFLSFHTQGTWVYALSCKAQQQIKRSIAGKTKQEALQLLTLLPGIKQASIHWEGFGDDTRLPKNRSLIHITLFVV